jgi:ATP-binding cassette, subfamily B, bacterial
MTRRVAPRSPDLGRSPSRAGPRRFVASGRRWPQLVFRAPAFRVGWPGLWRTVRRFRRPLLKRWQLVAASLASLVAEVGLRLLEPWPLKIVFDHVFAVGGATQTAPLGLDRLDPMALVAACSLGLLLVTVGRAAASYGSTVGFAVVGNRVLADVRSEVYRHLQRLSLGYHSRAKQGDLVVRVINDVGMLKEVVVTAFLPLLGNVLVLLGMFAVMLWLDWQLAVSLLLVLPLFWLRSSTVGQRIQEVARVQRKREGVMAATAAESLGSIRAVQALALEASFEGAFEGQNRKSIKEDVKAKRLAAGLERSFDVLIALATSIVLFAGTRSVLSGTTTPGDLLVFLAYLKHVFNPLRNFAKYTGRLSKASAAGLRILDVLEEVPDVQDRPNALPAPALRGRISFEQVRFGYGGTTDALRDVSFTIRPGQWAAVTGASGGGKSTLISLILRLYDPTEGSVLIDGRDVRDYRLASLRGQISVVLQDDLLFGSSIADNIRVGRPDASRDEVCEAAELARAHDFVRRMPQGYETVIGERGVTLSGGQRRRLALARAALRRAPVLLLDEPTSGLDEESERDVIDSIVKMASGTTTVLVTHNLQLAARADVVLCLEDGQLVEMGTPHELFQQRGRFAALHHLQTVRPRPSGERVDHAS